MHRATRTHRAGMQVSANLISVYVRHVFVCLRLCVPACLQAKTEVEEKLATYDPNNDPMIEVCSCMQRLADRVCHACMTAVAAKSTGGKACTVAAAVGADSLVLAACLHNCMCGRAVRACGSHHSRLVHLSRCCLAPSLAAATQQQQEHVVQNCHQQDQVDRLLLLKRSHMQDADLLVCCLQHCFRSSTPSQKAAAVAAVCAAAACTMHRSCGSASKHFGLFAILQRCVSFPYFIALAPPSPAVS